MASVPAEPATKGHSLARDHGKKKSGGKSGRVPGTMPGPAPDLLRYDQNGRTGIGWIDVESDELRIRYDPQNDVLRRRRNEA
jgi:hypothetical protein